MTGVPIGLAQTRPSTLTSKNCCIPPAHSTIRATLVNDPDLTTNEKRAILSSWASMPAPWNSYPALRQPPGASKAVSFDDVVEALRSLDNESGKRPHWKRRLTRGSGWEGQGHSA